MRGLRWMAAEGGFKADIRVNTYALIEKSEAKKKLRLEEAQLF